MTYKEWKEWSDLVVSGVSNHVKNIYNGDSQVSDDEQEERRGKCETCDRSDGDRCLECSCILFEKVKWAAQQCPLGKW